MPHGHMHYFLDLFGVHLHVNDVHVEGREASAGRPRHDPVRLVLVDGLQGLLPVGFGGEIPI